MSNKSKNASTKTTNPSKEVELTKKNVEQIVATIRKGKESKYAYPEGTKTPAEKKTFRRNARATGRKYDAQMEKLKASEEKKDQKEYKRIFLEKENWVAITYIPGVK